MSLQKEQTNMFFPLQENNIDPDSATMQEERQWQKESTFTVTYTFLVQFQLFFLLDKRKETDGVCADSTQAPGDIQPEKQR